MIASRVCGTVPVPVRPACLLHVPCGGEEKLHCGAAFIGMTNVFFCLHYKLRLKLASPHHHHHHHHYRLFVCGIGKDTGTEEPGTLNLKSICQLHSCLRVCVWGGCRGAVYWMTGMLFHCDGVTDLTVTVRLTCCTCFFVWNENCCGSGLIRMTMLYISSVLTNGPHICESNSYTLKSSWTLETGLQMLKFYKHRGHLYTSNRSAKLDEVSNTGGVILDRDQQM